MVKNQTTISISIKNANVEEFKAFLAHCKKNPNFSIETKKKDPLNKDREVIEQKSMSDSEIMNKLWLDYWNYKKKKLGEANTE